MCNDHQKGTKIFHLKYSIEVILACEGTNIGLALSLALALVILSYLSDLFE